METYKIKTGDTLTNIAKQYGVSVSDLTTNNGIKDPNLIQTGQTISIPKKSSILGAIGNVAKTIFAPVLSGGNILATGIDSQEINPVVTPNEVNIGNLPITPITPVNQPVTVLSYKDNPDGTTTNYLSDGTTSTVNYSKNKDGSLTPTGTVSPITPVTNEDTIKTKSLLDQSTSIQSEISTLEKSIADKSANRQSAYEQAGVFDDIKKLNDLKDTLKVNLEERGKLRGLGATSTEFTQATSPILEKNYIESATLSNIVNANIAAIDQKINDKYTSDTFLLEQKNKRLDNITKTYGDIITEQQKAKIEEVKQKNSIDLENIKAMNDITKNAATEAIKADPSRSAEIIKAIQSGDTAKLYTISGKNQVDNSQSIRTIDTIQSMLNNPDGLAGSVGPNAVFGRDWIPGDKDTSFRTDAKLIASQATLDYFIKLKSNGATFGAMSDAEWAIISSAAATANLGINKEKGTSNLGEVEFKKRLEEYQNVSRKAVTANALTLAGIDPTFLKNIDATTGGDTIKALYDKYVVPQAEASKIDYTQQDIGTNFIQKQEGFSPTAYKDQAGVWTIGYGTTKINGQPVKPTDTITEAEAKKVALQQAATDYSTFADKLGDTVLSPNQFVALNSFEYNLGPGVWNQPTGKQILASIQSGDLNTAQSLMQKFVNVKNPQTGQLEPNQSLITRRQQEGKLLLS